MDAQRDITVAIKTLFDGSGFKSFASGLKILTKQAMDMNTVVRQNLTTAYKKLGDAVMFNQRSQEEYWSRYMSNVKGASRTSESLSKKLKKNEGHFHAWALSIMFAGMQMMAIFKQIWSMGSTTFQDVMHSVEGTTTGFDMLQGSMKYLGFIIGEALEPVATWLAPIIIKLAEWINDNQEIFKTVVVIVGAVGSLLFVVGQTVLAVGGLITAFKNVGTIGKHLFSDKLPGYFTTLKTELGLAKTAFQGLSTAGKIGFVGMVAGIILAIIWIFKLKEAIGSWGDFFKGVLSGLIRMFLGVADAFITLILSPLQTMVALLLQASDALGFGAGSNGLQEFVKWKPTFLNDFLTKQQSSDWWAPDKGWAQGGGLTPTFNITNLNVNSDNVDEMMQQMTSMSQTGGI